MAASQNAMKVCGLWRGLRGYSQFVLVSSNNCKLEPSTRLYSASSSSFSSLVPVVHRRIVARNLSSFSRHPSAPPHHASPPARPLAATVVLHLPAPAGGRRGSAGVRLLSTSSDQLSTHETLPVRTVNGLLELSIPMLSRREKCRFTLQPFAETLGDFLASIRLEDSAIETVQATNLAGELIASSTSIDIVMKQDFLLTINSQQYLVQGAVTNTACSPTISDANEDVHHLVANLYRTINSDLYLEAQRRHLQAKQEQIRLQLEPMEKLRAELERKAEKRTRLLSWVGLGLMGAQFGFMARLTWWEYSWDVMEPVTYFVGYATAIAAFGYYVITRQDYTYPDAREREFLVTLHRSAGQHQFDIVTYNHLRSQLSLIERDLARLRDPLDAHLPLVPITKKTLNIDTAMPWPSSSTSSRVA